MADFCALNIVSVTPEQIRSQDKLQNFSGRARLTGGLWTFKVDKADGVSCPGGGTAPTTETYAFDNETFAGTHTILGGAVCGMQPDMKKQPFSLQLVGLGSNVAWCEPSHINSEPLHRVNERHCWFYHLDCAG